MAEKRLSVKLQLNDKDFQKGLRKASSSMKKFGRTMKRTGETLSRNFSVPIGLAGIASIKMASDFEESLNKTRVAFGESSSEVEAFAKTTLESFGIAEGSALEMASLFGDMATAMGLSQTEAAGMSQSLVGLAGDLASFKNIGIEQAQTALAGIFTGETESLKKLGIVITEANLKQFGYNKTMTQSEKIAVRYRAVIEQTRKAQGDFARTSDGVANSSRVLGESIKQLGQDFGTLLLPLATKLISIFQDFTNKISSLNKEQKQLILNIAGIAAVAGPLIVVFGHLSTGIGSIIKLIRTLSAVVLANPLTALVTAVVALTAAIGFSLVDLGKFIKTAASFGKVGQVVAKIVLRLSHALGGLNPAQLDAAIIALNALGKEQKNLEGDVDDTTSSLEDQLKAIQKIQNVATPTGGGGGFTPQQAPDSVDPIKPIVSTATKAQPIVAKLFQTMEEGTNQANESAILTSLNFEVMMEKFQNGLNNFVNIASQVFTAFDGLIQSSFAKRNQELDNYYQKELNNINNSKRTEEQKANAIEQLDKDVNERRKTLQTKQARADKAVAVMNATIATAAAVAQALTAGPVAGPILASVVGALGAAQIATIVATPIPQLAEGGLAFGPTQAIVGDNFGAGVNPEVIAPLDKLKGMLSMETVNVVGTISGEDIVLASDRYKTRANRSF